MDRKIVPITPQSGGIPSPEFILCREAVISDYWDILLYKGINLKAERRFGKSCIIRKMDADGKSGFTSIYLSVFGIDDVNLFVNEIFEACKKKKLFSDTIAQQIDNGWSELAKRVKSDHFTPTEKVQTWKKKFRYLIEQIHRQHSDKFIVIFIDEFSLMLDSLEGNEGKDLLGFLRDIVHEVNSPFSEKLRFVLAGSIGLDLILYKIKHAGHNIGDPLNHLETKDVPPFNRYDTIYFCQCLAAGCGMSLDESVIEEIYNITEGYPFFIEKIVEKIRYLNPIEKEHIQNALTDILSDSTDNTHLGHFYDRINTYYLDQDLAVSILNHVCQPDRLVSEKEIIKVATATLERTDIQVKDKISKLRADGYIERTIIDDIRYYKFKYQIIQKWWKLNKA